MRAALCNPTDAGACWQPAFVLRCGCCTRAPRRCDAVLVRVRGASERPPPLAPRCWPGRSAARRRTSGPWASSCGRSSPASGPTCASCGPSGAQPFPSGTRPGSEVGCVCAPDGDKPPAARVGRGAASSQETGLSAQCYGVEHLQGSRRHRCCGVECVRFQGRLLRVCCCTGGFGGIDTGRLPCDVLVPLLSVLALQAAALPVLSAGGAVMFICAACPCACTLAGRARDAAQKRSFLCWCWHVV